MVVIGILGAGLGTRLNPYTLTKPKPLVELPDGTSLLSNSIEFFNNTFDLPRIIVVAGYKYDLFIDNLYLSDCNNLDIVFNPFYRVAGPLGSIWTLLKECSVRDADSLMICNGDVILFDECSEIIKDSIYAIDRPNGYSLFFSKNTTDSDDSMKVAVGSDNSILAVSKGLDAKVIGGFSAGVFLIKGKEYISSLKEMLHRVLVSDNNAIDKWNWHSVLNVLISNGIHISAIELDSSSWLEVDSPKEYIELVEKFRTR